MVEAMHVDESSGDGSGQDETASFVSDILDGIITTRQQVVDRLAMRSIEELSMLPDEDGVTPLLAACRANSLEVARALLDLQQPHPADVNAPCTEQLEEGGAATTFPLLEACDELSEDMVRLLLEHGADIGCRDQDGDGALMRAVDAIVEAQDPQAAEDGAMGLIELLLARGVPLTKDGWSYTRVADDTPLEMAYGAGLLKVVAAIQAHISAANEEEKLEAFKATLRSHHVALGRWFLTLPGLAAKLREMDFRKLRPSALFLLLEPAAMPAIAEDFAELFDEKASQVSKEWDVWQNEARDEHGRIILQAAMAQGSGLVLAAVATKSLLELREAAMLDAFFEATRYLGQDFWSRVHPDDEWFEFAAADYSMKSHDFPLRSLEGFQRLAESAIRVGNLNALRWKVDYLIEHQDWTVASPELERRYDELVLALLRATLQTPPPPSACEAFKSVVEAYRARHPAEPWLLTRAVGGSPSSPTMTHLLVQSGRVDEISHLLAFEAPPVDLAALGPATLADHDEALTPMAIALLRGDKQMVELLHAQGVALALSTPSKARTGLHLAVMSGVVEVAKLLEATYPNPDLQDGEQRTPLHHAAMRGHLDMARYLVNERLASPAVRDENFQIPMDLARSPALRNAVFYSPWQIALADIAPYDPTTAIVGSGQYGKAYLTSYRRQRVVLKAVNQPEALQRELQRHSRVRDLNVVTLWGTTTLLTGEQALVLEHCEKGDLRRCLANGSPAWSAAQRLSLCLDVAWGMSHVHRVDIVHCDLKASNVFISTATTATGTQYRAKVGDFGISAWQGQVLPNEQYSGAQPPEEASLPSTAYPGKPGDVYRFGYLLLEAMVLPHRYSEYDTSEVTFYDVAAVLPGPLPGGSWSSPELCHLVLACLDPSPDLRPTFASVAASLEAIVSTAP